MDSTKSQKISKLPKASQDLISNLPSRATDKILKRLPLSMAAKMGVLSTQWRDKWLSHKYLVFDEAFWNEHGYEGEIINRIIINILLRHNGPIHKFHLYSDEGEDEYDSINLSQYLSFLSRTRVKEIALINCSQRPPLPSHIFLCKELVKLTLHFHVLNRPPSGFKGFVYLLSLKLNYIEFKYDILGSLISSCPRLKLLWIKRCIGITHLTIDAPNLEILELEGEFAPIHFTSVARLRRIILLLETAEKNNQASKDDALNSIKLLATSCELEYLKLGGDMCKVVAAGGVTNPHCLAFRHLKELCLMYIDLGDLDEFCFTLGMIQSCPCIRDLDISVYGNKDAARHKIEFDHSYKLDHLVKMKIVGITGSSAELQFLEYVLSISVVLENLYLKYTRLDSTSELKVFRDLLRFRRASSRAQVFWLDK